ncbi:MAG: S41 family peptidase [Gemmatimonadales bacterium]|jgi:carboxyl-terminal processing protease
MRVSARLPVLAVLIGCASFPTNLVGQDSVPDGTQLTVPPADRILTLATFWSEVKYNFAFWDRVPELDWDATFAEYCERALAVESDIEFFRLAIEFSDLLGEAHTNIILPRRLWPAYGAQPFIELSPAGNEAAVTNIASGLADRIPVGSVVNEIDGIPLRQYLAEHVDPWVAASTPQYQFAMSLMGEDEQIAGALMGRPGTEVTLGFVAPDGSVHSEAFVRQPLEEFAQADWVRHGRVNKPHFEWRWLEDDIAYVAIHVFWDEAVVERFEEIVPQLRERARGIIVDVRLNGGGNSAYGDQIGSYFTDGPVPVMRWTSPKHVAAYKAWGSRRNASEEYRAYGEGSATIETELQVLDPAPGPALSVPTVLLQSAYTYSAAENFVLVMQQMSQVTTMGTTTAGSTGQPLILRLPHGIYAGITSKRDMTPEGEDFVGVGLAPDVEVLDTPASIADGRDLQLERAVELLVERQGRERGQR